MRLPRFIRTGGLLFKINFHPLGEYIWEILEKEYKLLKNIEKGSDLSIEEVNFLTKALFHIGKGNYTGIDSNVPSRYFKLYPIYLSEHRNYIKKGGKSIRVLIVNHDREIHEDAIKNPKGTQDFLKWHIENNVELRYVLKKSAEEKRKAYKLPSTDMGIWSESFAVVFIPKENKVNIRIVPKSSSKFSECTKYCEEIVKNSRELTALKGIVLSKKLAQVWKDYIGNREAFVKFLERILEDRLPKKHSRIIDVAPGIGEEAISLLHKGFDVEINEIDIEFNRIIKDRLTSEGLKLVNVFQYDWRELDKNLKNNTYGAVLCLGNSLCMLNKEERKRCIDSFYNLLANDGVLIIDERNFSSIFKVLKNKGRLLKEELMKSLNAKDMLYNGKAIKCYLSLENGKINFEFCDKSGQNVGDIATVPFDKNELLHLLKKAGFREIEVYADFSLAHSPHETSKENFSVKYKDNVAFYTYVARK